MTLSRCRCREKKKKNLDRKSPETVSLMCRNIFPTTRPAHLLRLVEELNLCSSSHKWIKLPTTSAATGGSFVQPFADQGTGIKQLHTVKKLNCWRCCLALCDEMFDHFHLFDETLRHIELCNSVICQIQWNHPHKISNSVGWGWGKLSDR